MNTVNLYNQDGTLSTQAQLLLSPRPDNISFSEWRKTIKKFKDGLVAVDLERFQKLQKREYNKRNPEKRKVRSKRYRARNLTREKQRCANYRKQNPDKVKATNKAYIENNRSKVKAFQKQWRHNHPEKRREFDKKAQAKRNAKYKNDPFFKLKKNLRYNCRRVVKTLALGKKPTSTFKWVGCSPKEFKSYIESLFQEGMTWDNYGKYGWHIDHIRPVSSFKPEEWEQINHYTNLQPLWAEDNWAKGDTWTNGQPLSELSLKLQCRVRTWEAAPLSKT